MIKSILLFTTILLLAGCGTKPIVVQQKPVQKPILPVEKTPTVEPTAIEPAVEEPEQEPIEETLNKSNAVPYVTTLKTQKFSYSDAGFLRNQNGVIDLQMFAVGRPLVKLKISEDVCVDHYCITKQEFNQEYLSDSYPDDLINQVLTSQPIFDSQNLKKTSNGFMQRIIDPRFDIKYKITPGSIYFKDLKNGIIIKLRELH